MPAIAENRPVARRTIIAGFRPSAPKRVAIVAFDGVVLSDLAGPLDLLSRVRDHEGRLRYEVHVCSATADVETRHLRLRVDRRLGWAERADLVIVPGADRADREPPPALVRAIRRAAGRGARIASVCTGAFVLAAAG